MARSLRKSKGESHAEISASRTGEKLIRRRPFFSKIGLGNTFLQPKVKFTNPAFFRKSPIEKVLGNVRAGLTTPVFSGKAITNDKAGQQALFDAIRPKSFNFDNKTNESRIDDYDIDYSANVQALTNPANGKWRKYIPGKNLKKWPACANKNHVPVVLTGKPDSKTIVAWIDSNEQEHVDDLKAATKQHIEPFYKRVLAIRGKGNDRQQSTQDLFAQIDKDNKATANTYLRELAKKVVARDAKGNHELQNDIRLKSDPGDPCVRVVIKSSTKK